jgi:class 3 adenylate cyclase
MPVNVASRLEKLARKHEILVSETTYQEVSDRFLAEKATSPVFIGGLADPVDVYRILGRA